MELIYDYITQNPIEVLGAAFGLVSIWYSTKENLLVFPLGIISVVCYTLVFWDVYLFGDFALSILYFFMLIYGWYNWVYGNKTEDDHLPITWASNQERLLLLLLGIFSFLGIGRLFQLYTQNTVPYWDAFTTAFSVIGQWLVAKKRIENWLIWIIVNIVSVVIYYYKGLTITSGLYSCYLVLAFVGFFSWQKKLKLSN